MEKRRCRYILGISNKTSSVLLLLMILCFQYKSVQCQERITPIRRLSSAPPAHSKPSEFKNGVERILLSIALGVITGLIGAILFACLVRCFVGYMNQTPLIKGPVVFSPKIDPKTLHAALANENLLLGSSPNGKYYRTVLDNGLTIAVRRVEPFESGSPEKQNKSVKRRIQQELEILASLRTQEFNELTGLWRINCSLDGRLGLGLRLVLLRGFSIFILLAIPQILHYNLKPTNVMLDAEFAPRLADFGLAKLMPGSDIVTSAYSPPECFQNRSYTEKSDVFSFGMILAVLLTGRDPTDPFFCGSSQWRKFRKVASAFTASGRGTRSTR
ncbi:Receptor-like kinase [Melia azedarach]|uniref:Receptor-like kinase n=1 Tax=Melia azedarach TaxID=155640 RepID=A0ACC1Y989_MELAZ|nr:Receptor-like kinase [Melia azedarach]